jgi:transposase-like protein
MDFLLDAPLEKIRIQDFVVEMAISLLLGID